ncbi:MAG: hypothetical protein KZQ89_15075 [Candidatus Thiodiazotropha sp. (ex Lucinoma kastoroae)]|nr:hypothetical protein [Candidatus Thiodiazotropha sp. (ex Lucinoma kastoroae)]MCU7861867.1 hypothetical protein [Candidatus Thiodiazotropha sp. (ex Lucinoma kastoroae)]
MFQQRGEAGTVTCVSLFRGEFTDIQGWPPPDQLSADQPDKDGQQHRSGYRQVSQCGGEFGEKWDIGELGHNMPARPSGNYSKPMVLKAA